jgi:hypothetical protein
MRLILRGMKLSIKGDDDIAINLVIAAFFREWRECADERVSLTRD